MIIMNVMLEVMRMSINKVSAAYLKTSHDCDDGDSGQNKDCGKVRYDNYEEPSAENDDDSK